MHDALVMKFGGASVATPDSFDLIADLIIAQCSNFKKIIVVLSAMGGTTDELIALAKKVNPEPPRRELDMLVSVGERISISLLAMALAKKNRTAVSFTGSQSGIITTDDHTDAKIIDVRPFRLIPYLEKGSIVIVAGFQGVSRSGEITTLGRGGSDTTAVALGVAFGVDCVEFYKDVPGIFSEDPKKNPNASLYETMSYHDVLKILEKGGKILHSRSVKLAMRNHITLRVRSFTQEGPGTTIRGVVAEKNSPCYEEH